MIKHLFKYLIGIIIISFIFWTRFLRDRNKPVTAEIFNNILFEYIKIIFIICLITYFTLSLIKNLKKILNITYKGFLSKKFENNITIQKLKNIFHEYIIDAPNYLYENLTANKNIKPFIEQPASYFTVYLYYPRTLVFTLLMLPRVIVATMFILSILYFKNMIYFFYSLNILIPLIIFKIFIYIIHQFSRRYLDTIETYIEFEEVQEPQQGYILHMLSLNMFKSTTHTYEHYVQQFPTICNIWQIYTTIYNYMQDIKYEQDAMSPYVQVYTSLCFIISWSYIFYNLL
jgi:hypothetical protein